MALSYYYPLSLAEKVDNAALMLITMTGRVLMVRDCKDKTWMIPGGTLRYGEEAFYTAIREFQEETSFLLDMRYVFLTKDCIITHTNGKKTKIFVMYSTQRFPDFVLLPSNKETDAVHYCKISEIKHFISTKSTTNLVVGNIKSYNLNSFKKMLDAGMF